MSDLNGNQDEEETVDNLAEMASVLCAERVSQMTKTYNDIEAVTRLLEEKENDLELAARIGQGLLDHNKKLEAKNEALEDQFTEALEKISQLRHELNMKDALLQSYTEDYELELDSSGTFQYERFTVGKGISECEILQKKVKLLQDENVQLKNETEQLATETCSLEEKEVTLVSDCVRQLDDANKKGKRLQDELNAKSDVCVAQQEENTNLMCKVIAVETSYKKQLAENSGLQKQLKEMQSTQQQLSHEIMELEEKYNECMSLLHEKLEEIKSLKKKAKPSVIHQHYGTSPFFRAEGSLALELEKSETEETCPYEYRTEGRRKHLHKVMQTAKVVRKTMKRDGSHTSLSSLSLNSGYGGEDESTRALSDAESSGWSDNFSHTDLELGALSGGSRLGRLDLPGSNDLETALRKLALREANEINQIVLEEQDRQNENYALAPPVSGASMPTPCRTPESCMSTGSEWSRLSSGGGGGGLTLSGSYRVPEKLQIVKPIEGSLTLHQWQRLATPRLEGIFEVRPGVQVRGEKPVEMDEEIYTLSDYEEDDDLSYLQGKAVDSTAGTYTYTTSNVLHPTDEYVTVSVTNSHSQSKISASISTNTKEEELNNEPTISENEQVASSAKRPSSLALVNTTADGRSDGTTTFSMSFSLAAMLHERGLQKGEGGRNREQQGLISRVTSWISAPKRFSSITTETPSNTKHSKTETIYSQSSIYIPPLEGISATDKAMPYKPETAYLNLVEKVRELGLSNVIGIASSSGISPLKKDPIDVGLNTVMQIRRNRGGSAPPSRAQTLVVTSGARSGKYSKRDSGVNSKDGIGAMYSKTDSKSSSRESLLSEDSGKGDINQKSQQGMGILEKFNASANSKSDDVLSNKSKNSTGSNGGFLSGANLDLEKSSGIQHRISNSNDIGDNKISTENRSNNKKSTVENNINSSLRREFKQDYLNQQTSNNEMETDANTDSNLLPVVFTSSVVDRELSHSKVTGLGYAVTPPNFRGGINASVARDSVYSTMATGRQSAGGCYSMARNSGYSTSSISDSSMNSSCSSVSSSQLYNVGTGTIHSPMNKRNSGDLAGSNSGSSGLGAVIFNAVKPRSSAVIGGLTSTPILKSSKS